MGYNVIISVERHKNRMNRRLLITGAGGFLGSRICEYYSNRDGYEAVGVTHRELDIEDFVAVSAFIKAIRPYDIYQFRPDLQHIPFHGAQP